MRSNGDVNHPQVRVPGRLPGTLMVEAGGQFIRGFRCGLDYAFILKDRHRL
jgi:hypothetical protein